MSSTRSSVCMGTMSINRFAIVEVQARGHSVTVITMWLIFRHVGLIFVGVACPRKLVPNENFYVYGISFL